VRIDRLLVERGLVPNRELARRLVMAGEVLVGDRPVTKPGAEVADDAALRLRTPASPYASRGGEKLAGALDAFGLDPTGLLALDVGASTGGFTDCLLRRGARGVIAVDVGYGQLHPRLRNDDRVVVMERTNARELEPLPFAPGLVVCDVSFISLRKALGPALKLAAPGWEAVVLVKPQFEAGRGEVVKGVVTSNETRARVTREIAEAAVAWEAETVGVVDSDLPGPKGNRELFLHLRHRPGAGLPTGLDRWIADAVH